MTAVNTGTKYAASWGEINREGRFAVELFINVQDPHTSFSSSAVFRLLFDCASCDISIYPAFRTRDACVEDGGGNEEVDAEVQVDGGSWAFDGSHQGERQDAEEQAD